MRGFRAAGIVAVLLALAAANCRRPTSVQSKPAAANPVVAVPHSRQADDVARFLAGLPGKPGSPYAELEATAAWRQHRALLDASWKNAGENLIDGLAAFRRKELEHSPADKAPIFYPFSGPDALTPLVWFPYSDTYVLVALEPAGTLPKAKGLGKKNLAAYLGATRKTMSSLLGKSFFVTREMDREFRGQVTDGLLLPILHLLVRTNHNILGFQYIRLDEAGKVVERAADYHAPGIIGNKGVALDFQAGPDAPVQRLYYFSVNLADNRLRENHAFLKYAATLKGSTTMLKATSYMTHRPEFSRIRELVVEVSGAVLQDDSGIPYHYFDPHAWKVQLYGDYQRPYGSFRWLEQKDLRAAYRGPGVKPLPMRIGYGFGRITSNLLLAEHK
jgi:hypothetical protein